MKQLANGAHRWIQYADTYRGQRVSIYMEDLAWFREKREGGCDLYLLIRTCFIQGLYNTRIKTIVKTKRSINTPMAQLVEVALEEESAIRSERFKRNPPEKWQF